MFESPVSKRIFISIIGLSLILVTILFILQKTKRDSFLVFCHVGQGDAAYIRLENEIDIVIDAGPDRKILDCLGKYMPFYDRTIEYAFISHPQRDHFGGYLYLTDLYRIKSFWLSEVTTGGKLFSQLLDSIKKKKIPMFFPKSGEKLKIKSSTFVFLWPTQDYLSTQSVIDKDTDTQLRRSGLDINNFSLVFLFTYKGFQTLFTGDISNELLKRLPIQSKMKLDVLKIPHHGSKKGLSVEFLKLAHPTYGVISVGKTNSYGHPSKDILAILEASEVKIKRTDKDGDILFKLR